MGQGPRGELVEADGFRLWVERTGVGPPIVLVHGLGDDHTLWRHVVPRLARRFETLAVDMPGHGRSDPIPEGAGIDWFAGRILALLDALALVDPVLVGLSMGGGVAQYVALAAPERLRALVLVSTSPVFPEATRKRFHDRADKAEREGMAAVADESISRWFTPAFAAAHPEEVARTQATFLANDPVAFARASRANAARDATGGLPTIKVPVLFVAGVDDPAGPERAIALYRDSIPNLRVELLEAASHLLPVEAPDRLVAILDDFLDRLPPHRWIAAAAAGADM